MNRIIAIMSCWGLFNVYAMRVNLSVAIEPMACQFNWTPLTQGEYTHLHHILILIIICHINNQ